MAETQNIAEMARKVFDELFSVFGWRKTGGVDRNFACSLPEQHPDKKTHPTDLVCWYEDPYELQRVYMNIDLKSYAATSITKKSIGDALRSLAQTVECANVSAEWREAYVLKGAHHRTHGLLFFYNNDGALSKADFEQRYSNALSSPLKLAKNRRLFVFSPSDIVELYSIANDINSHRATYFCQYGFACHDLIRFPARIKEGTAASIEMLLAPWLLVRLTNGRNENHPLKGGRHYLLYYRGEGRTVEEFAYVIDYMFRFQLLDNDSHLELRLVNAAENATEVWARAVEYYVEKFHGLADIRKRLEPPRVKCSSVTTVLSRFSAEEIGMERK